MDDVVEVEFRDGAKFVPVYLDDLFRISRLETWTMTFEEAVSRANRGLLAARLNLAQQDAVAAHLKKGRI